MAKQLRVHHILCTKLFQGHGYSDGFARGMEQQVSLLRRQPFTEIEPVAHPDAICSACPHLTAENTCDSNNNEVEKKDESLRKMLHLEEDTTYTYEDLLGQVHRYFTEEDFQIICGDCSWNKEGLCSYEQLIKTEA